MNKLLLIDDDQELTELLQAFLELEGFEVQIASDGQAGLERLAQESFDLLLLDVMMPRMNGFDTLKALRQSNNTPVLMLTAKGDDIDRVVGLELGADDYLPKPFNDRELLARIRAILRRTQSDGKTESEERDDQIQHGDIRLNPSMQEVLCQGQPVNLTSTEFLLLQTLLEHKGELLSKEVISETVLGKKLMPFDRSIDMHMSNLRRKLPPRKDEKDRVKTLRGRGYMWLET